MHNMKLWIGIALILLALLPSLGVSLGVVPTLTGPLLVIVAVAGGYFLAARRR